MKRYVAIVIRHSRKYDEPSSHNLIHNLRIESPQYLLHPKYQKANYNLKLAVHDVAFKEPSWCTSQWAERVWGQWIKEIETFSQNKTGRKMRSDAVRIEEGIIVLSYDHTRLQDANKIQERILQFVAWFEERHATRILSVDWHRDEGFYDADTDTLKTRNEHVHFLFVNLNGEGKALRRTWDIRGYELSQMQDKAAEIFKDLGYERGKNYYHSLKPKPNHLAPRQYRQKKQNEYQEEKQKVIEKEIRNSKQQFEQALQRVWNLFVRMRSRAKRLRQRLLLMHNQLMESERGMKVMEIQLMQAIHKREEELSRKNRLIEDMSLQLSRITGEKTDLARELDKKDEALQSLENDKEMMEHDYMNWISTLETDLARHEEMEEEDKKEEDPWEQEAYRAPRSPAPRPPSPFM